MCVCVCVKLFSSAFKVRINWSIQELVCKHWTNKSFIVHYRLEVVAIVAKKKNPNQNEHKKEPHIVSVSVWLNLS